MTRIILSTGNIVSGGPSIIRKSGTHRSNLEFTNSLRSNFEAAQQDYAALAEAERIGNGNGNGEAKENGANGADKKMNGAADHQPALDVWTAREIEEEEAEEKSDHGEIERKSATDNSGNNKKERSETLYIPRIDWTTAGLRESRSQYEITLKLFFLPTATAARRASYIRRALRLVMRELGVEDVDLFIVSFPGVKFEGDCEYEADKRNAAMGDDAEELAAWRVLEGEKLGKRTIAKLGIAEFGTEKLRRFLDSNLQVRPAVDQINVKNCCNVPPPLVDLAREEGIELYTHGDCTDVLPSGTLRELLSGGAGILASDDENESGAATGGLRGNLVPEWVVKYTAFVKDRGVIENKGYFAGAELVEKKRKFDSLVE